jgi:hypothetical protein
MNTTFGAGVRHDLWMRLRDVEQDLAHRSMSLS